jgi:hypothetical protein
VAPPPSVNQLQHMFSERKRREKLNDSFHALKAVLPPGAKVRIRLHPCIYSVSVWILFVHHACMKHDELLQFVL